MIKMGDKGVTLEGRNFTIIMKELHVDQIRRFREVFGFRQQ